MPKIEIVIEENGFKVHSELDPIGTIGFLQSAIFLMTKQFVFPPKTDIVMVPPGTKIKDPKAN